MDKIDIESREWKINKYISKCRAINPDKVPTYEEAGKIIDNFINNNRHVTYPLAGMRWSQVDWHKAALSFDSIDFTKGITICATKECPRKEECYRYSIFQFGVAPAKRAKRTLRLLSYITTARNILCMIENSLAVGNFRET